MGYTVIILAYAKLLDHGTKNWIYAKFTQCKFGAKKGKLRLNKRAKMVNTAFALKFTPP